MVSPFSADLDRNPWLECIQQSFDENSSQVNGNTQRQGSLGNSQYICICVCDYVGIYLPTDQPTYLATYLPSYLPTYLPT